MSHIYGLEKTHMAVFNLVGPGSMKSRLENAVNSHLLHICVEADIPKELSDDYRNIVETLWPRGRRSIIAKLSEVEAEHYAQKIVVLHEKMAHIVH
ncbi:hypothetical protein [Thalassomonas actiniarum]|uniref:Uncharacterized protein n=1 Tax=Thalassomonas actiniarum TaxID=485447 RepID=A0AAF0C5P3_9GAMM|nr:hypothetical protein [Thalassomonas actiniarum]WDE01110.1 hypothetical protein SG35_011010 [Thalassomonas actiniarum]